MRICRVFTSPMMNSWFDMRIGTENAAQIWQRAMSEKVLLCDMWAVPIESIFAMMLIDVPDNQGQVVPFHVVPQGEPPKAS